MLTVVNPLPRQLKGISEELFICGLFYFISNQIGVYLGVIGGLIEDSGELIMFRLLACMINSEVNYLKPSNDSQVSKGGIYYRASLLT